MKTPTIRSTLVVLSTLALFPACAKKKEDPKPAPQPIVQPQLTTDRNYVSGCDTVGPRLSYKHILFANNERVLLTTEAYQSDRCAPDALVYTIESTSSYKLGAVRAEKVLEIDSVEETVVMSPATIEQANTWNTIRYCGRADWSQNSRPVISRATSGCLDSVNKELPPFSIVKIEADRITLGIPTPNRGEDGLVSTRRYTSLENPMVYIRGGSIGVINPNPVGACPSLVGVYACTQGDSTFAGKNVNVTNATNANGRAIVRMELAQAGHPAQTLDFIPGDAERISHIGGRQISERDYCEQGLMVNMVSISRENDAPNRTVTERNFGIDSSSRPAKLVINTKDTEFQNDRPGRTSNVRTECVKIN